MFQSPARKGGAFLIYWQGGISHRQHRDAFYLESYSSKFSEGCGLAGNWSIIVMLIIPRSLG